MKTSTNGRRVSKESVAKIPMRNRFVCGCALAINGAATMTPSMTISLRRFFIVSLESHQYARLFQRKFGQSFANKVAAKAAECRIYRDALGAALRPYCELEPCFLSDMR